jgi:ABC-2 type transport system permease protein
MMTVLLSIIKNEHQKLYKRSRMWISFALLLIINVIIGVFFKFVFKGAEFSFWDYIQISSYLLLVVQLISIIVAGDIVSNEFEKGTIKFLFLRPVKRIYILGAKYITVLTTVGFLVLIQLFISTIIGLIFYYQSLLILDQKVLIGLASYLFQIIEISVMATIAFSLSTITRSSVVAISIPIFLLFTSSAVITLLEHYHIEEAKYLLFSNTDLLPYFFGQPLFEGMTLFFSILNILLHITLLLGISSYLFTKRDIHV